jgi:hypothetical protein
MSRDVLIVSGIAFTQLVITWYGVHVSTGKHRIRNAFVIGIIGAVGIGLTVWGAVRSAQAQSALEAQLNQIQKNTETPPKVEVNVQSPTDSIKASQDALRLDERPWLGTGPSRFIAFNEITPFKATIPIVNEGKTPAVAVQVWLAPVTSATQLDHPCTTIPVGKFDEGPAIAPHGVHVININDVTVLLAYEPITKGQTFLYYCGEVKYQDSFIPRASHSTKFCYAYMSGNPELVLCRKGNDMN